MEGGTVNAKVTSKMQSTGQSHMFPKKIDKLSFTTPVGGVLVLGWMVTTHMISPQD